MPSGWKVAVGATVGGKGPIPEIAGGVVAGGAGVRAGKAVGLAVAIAQNVA